MTDYTVKLNPEKVTQLRRQYRQLQENGYNTATFIKVQARNNGVHISTIRSALHEDTWKDVDND